MSQGLQHADAGLTRDGAKPLPQLQDAGKCALAHVLLNVSCDNRSQVVNVGDGGSCGLHDFDHKSPSFS